MQKYKTSIIKFKIYLYIYIYTYKFFQIFIKNNVYVHIYNEL